MPRQQVTRAAKPGQKRRHGPHIEPRRSALAAAVAMPQVHAVMQVQVRQMQVRAAGQQGQGAQAETHQETDQVELRPCHERLRGL